jgi:hypothetical protein
MLCSKCELEVQHYLEKWRLITIYKRGSRNLITWGFGLKYGVQLTFKVPLSRMWVISLDPLMTQQRYQSRGLTKGLINSMSKVFPTKGVQVLSPIDVEHVNDGTSAKVCGWNDFSWGISMLKWWTHTWGGRSLCKNFQLEVSHYLENWRLSTL